MPDGKSIWHADLKIGDSHLFLADESVSPGAKSAKTLGASPCWIQLNVTDADASWKRAVDAGARVLMPLADMFWGDRYGSLIDPFGYVWNISQHVKDLTPEELQKAGEAAAKEFAQKK